MSPNGHFSLTLKAVFVGVFAKISSVVVVLLVTLGVLATPVLLGIKPKPIPNPSHPEYIKSLEKPNHSIEYIFERTLDTILIAPVIENLVMAAIFEIIYKYSKSLTLPIFPIVIIAFFAHAGGFYGLNGAWFFLCFAIFYSRIRKHNKWTVAYIYSTIAHVTTNAIALVFALT